MVDENGQRVAAFGKFGGVAGMVYYVLRFLPSANFFCLPKAIVLTGSYLFHLINL